MSKKKFNISPELASGLRNTIQSASNRQGQLHYDVMSLDVIETDPNNPRQLSITFNEMINGIDASSIDISTKSKELDAINELSKSILKIGVKSAIEVYKDGSRYRIITGERRYLAAKLAGLKNVPVRISTKPDEFTLRYTQWVENINRQDLSLWEKFNNLTSISDAFKKSNQSEFNEDALQKLLGISNIQTYRYFSLLNADKKIIDLVKAKKIKNLKIVQELNSMKDNGARNQIISWIAASKNEITSLANYRENAGKKPKRNKSNLSQNSINLGKVSNPKVAKQIFQIVLDSQEFENQRAKFNSVDWSSAKSITKAFKLLFEVLENEIRTEELA